MSSLEHSPRLGRQLRMGTAGELAEPTRALIEAAVAAGRTSEALSWLQYMLFEAADAQRRIGTWDWHLVQYHLQRAGNVTWPWLVRTTLAPWLATTMGLPGQPMAEVESSGTGACFAVAGFTCALHLHDAGDHYELTLDAPGFSRHRAARWKAMAADAIQSGDSDHLHSLLDEWEEHARLAHDVLCDWTWALLTLMVRTWGEPLLGEIERVTLVPWLKAEYEALPQLTLEEALAVSAEALRGHFAGRDRSGRITVQALPDRYILSFDACGSGGRMLLGDPTVGSGSRLEAPYHFARLEGAYAWTWQQRSVSAFCTHCAMVNQVLPIEWVGHPLRMADRPATPEIPCRWVIYKRTEDYPEQAYASVGAAKPTLA